MSAEEKTEDTSARKWGLRLAAIGAVLVVWEVAGSALNPIFLSTPPAIVGAFIKLLETGSGPFSLVGGTIDTLEATFVSFAIAIAIGLPVGLMMGMFRKVGIVIFPYVSALYMTPRVALIPLIVIWFGVGFDSIIVIGFILAVFLVIINTYAGVRDISKTLLETADVFQIKGLRRFRLIIFPSILPFFMTGVRLAIGQALIGVIVAELLLAGSGLGFILSSFAEFFQTGTVMALVLELAAIGIVLTYTVHAIENRIAYWKQTERAFK